MSIDPKLQYCQCGYTWKFNKLELLLMFLHLRNTIRCPQCQSIMEYQIIYHTVKMNTRKVLDEDIWRKC